MPDVSIPEYLQGKVFTTFTHQCRTCGGTIRVVDTEVQPHDCHPVPEAAVEAAAVLMCATDRQESVWAILTEDERNDFRRDARVILVAALPTLTTEWKARAEQAEEEAHEQAKLVAIWSDRAEKAEEKLAKAETPLSTAEYFAVIEFNQASAEPSLATFDVFITAEDAAALQALLQEQANAIGRRERYAVATVTLTTVEQ